MLKGWELERLYDPVLGKASQIMANWMGPLVTHLLSYAEIEIPSTRVYLVVKWG